MQACIGRNRECLHKPQIGTWYAKLKETTLQVSKEEAVRRIEDIQEPYKLEILDDISERHPDEPITIYHVGEPGSKNHWWDLCAGPHVESTGDLNPAAVELESVAGEQSSRAPFLTKTSHTVCIRNQLMQSRR